MLCSFCSRLGTVAAISFAIAISSTLAASVLHGNLDFPWDITKWRVDAASAGQPPRDPIEVQASASAAEASSDFALEADSPRPLKKHTPSPSSSGSRGFEYAVGDLLKITFFERLQSETTSQAERRIGALVERTDLSGQFTVQLNGSVFVPLLGEVGIARLSQQAALHALAERGRAILGGNLEVAITVNDREPVYVMGALPRSGSFRHSPGMVVAQVVALAGGGNNGASETWKQMDVVREHERQRRSLQRQITNLALVEVLDAEGSDTPAAPSKRLTALAGPRAAELIASTRDARLLERNRVNAQIAALDKLIRFAQDELASARGRLNEVAALVTERSNRFKAAFERFGRGASTEAVIAMAKSEMDEIRSRWHELRQASTRSEARIVELQRDRDQVAISARVDYEQQLRSARAAIAEEEIVASTIGQILMTMPQLALSSAREQRYTIIRRGAQGARELPAGSLTPVEPGDLVRIDDLAVSSIEPR